MKKMYILVRDSVIERDPGHAILSVAHAAAAACRDWGADPDFEDWARNSFRKVLCRVSDKEFDRAEACDNIPHRVMTECALDDEPISIVFKPQAEWPKFFKFLKLWRGDKSSASTEAALEGIPAPPAGYKLVGWGSIKVIKDKADIVILDLPEGGWCKPGCRGGHYIYAIKE